MYSTMTLQNGTKRCDWIELILDLIVTKDHEATLFATYHMLQGETGITAVAANWEAGGWSVRVSH
jgi:hypothetical protein